MNLLKLLFMMLVSCHLYGIGLSAIASSQDDELLRLSNEAFLLYQQGKYPQAVETGRKALDVAEKAFESNHPHVATSLSNLAVFYNAQGQYAQAEPLLQRSLTIREKALGTDHPDMAT